MLMLFSVFSFTYLLGQMVILSGPEQASYYRFVEDIINVMTDESDKAYINKTTSGAAYNFDQLADPNSPYKIAMIQSDILYSMQALDNRNNTTKTKSIKVVLPLANEEIHIVTKKNSGLLKLQDLDSMKVAIGSKNQGTFATGNLIKDKSQVYWKSISYHFDEALKALYMDKTDAFMIVGSAPIEKLNMDPRAMVEELAFVELNDFNGWAKYYDNDTIYADDYKWLEVNVPTFSIRTVLVVNEAKLSDDDRTEISRLVNGIKSKYDVLKAQGHPKWKEVNFDNWSNSDWPIYR
ncbi:MAG: hypothetical protein K8R68_04820 [Bacteroidales bacterium]|nr:hypothetical protein [Bacteroidales bacterium]